MTITDLKAKFPKLVSAIVSFSGSGDEGNCEVEEIVGVNEDDEFDDAEDDLIDAAYDILSTNYGGWENNDGGDGQISFDFQTNKIKLVFASYEMIRSDEEVTEIDF